jgi:flagellar biosynthesis/type III secretory pathway chaperone
MEAAMNPQHQTLCTQMRDHLDAELSAHRSLLTLAERKQGDLVRGNMDGFTKVLAQEQASLIEVGRLRQIRDRLLRALATVFNLPPVEIRLSVLLERLPEPLRAELRRRQEDLKTLLERLRVLNDRNALLIRQSLGLVRDLLGALMGSGQNAGGYDRRGMGPSTVFGDRGQLINIAG